jgi:hypothetical protein
LSVNLVLTLGHGTLPSSHDTSTPSPGTISNFPD